MRRAIAALLLGLLWMATMGAAQGDPLDDLLSGVPAKAEQADSSAAQPVSSALEDPFTVPFDASSRPDRGAWEATVVHPSQADLAGGGSVPAKDSLPPMSVSLVPEPSAILLAALAMLYFVIFFRRRNFA